MPTVNKAKLILGIAPDADGFGYVLFEGTSDPVAWGRKRATGSEKNETSLKAAGNLFNDFKPDTAILEDHAGEGSRRAERIAALIDEIDKLAQAKGIAVHRYCRAHVRRCFADKEARNKHQIANAIVKDFPEFEPDLPPLRKIWIGESPRMALFDAVALVLCHFRTERNTA